MRSKKSDIPRTPRGKTINIWWIGWPKSFARASIASSPAASAVQIVRLFPSNSLRNAVGLLFAGMRSAYDHPLHASCVPDVCTFRVRDDRARGVAARRRAGEWLHVA